jgi:3-hydroxyisobutyrate dehydrogenase-like beta-hydroxyacid dehydrogenase
MGRKSLYVGSFGKAKLLKIANAMIHAAEATAVYEVLTWSMRNQVEPEHFLTVFAERDPRRPTQLKRILEGDLERRANWVAKDVYHGIKNAAEREIPMPVLSSVHSTINLAKSQVPEEYAFSGAMWKFYEQALKSSG